MFFGRTDAEGETPVFDHLMQRVDSLEKKKKIPDVGRDWGREEKGKSEDEMAGWHYQLDAHEFG